MCGRSELTVFVFCSGKPQRAARKKIIHVSSCIPCVCLVFSLLLRWPSLCWDGNDSFFGMIHATVLPCSFQDTEQSSGKNHRVKWLWDDCFPCSDFSGCSPASFLGSYSQTILVSSFLESNFSVLITLYFRLFARAGQSCLLAPQHEEHSLLLVLHTHLVN